MPAPRGGPASYSAGTRAINFARAETVLIIRDWIANPLKSTLCLIAPPGEGKSWVLSYLNECLRGENHFPVFFLDDPQQYMLLQKDDPPLYILDEGRIKIWIEACYAEAAVFYGGVIPPFVPSNPPETSITVLVGAINTLFPVECKALVIVDGYDEMPEACQEIFAHRVLDRFIALSNDETGRKVLMALAQRNGSSHYSIPIAQDHLKVEMTDGVNHDPQLPGVRKLTDWEQFKRVHQRVFGGAPPVSHQDYVLWKSPLEFPFDNFFINHYLFACGLDGAVGALNPILPAHLKQCATDLLERPRPGGTSTLFPKVPPRYFEMLVEIALLDDPFVSAKLEEVIRKCDPGCGYNRFEHPFIKDLRNVYCVLTLDPTSYLRYQLNPSLRSILRDYHNLTHPGSVRTSNSKSKPNNPRRKGRNP